MSPFRTIIAAFRRPFGASGQPSARRLASRRRRSAAAWLGGCEQLEGKHLLSVSVLRPIDDLRIDNDTPVLLNLANHFDETSVSGTIVKFETNAPVGVSVNGQPALTSAAFFVELFQSTPRAAENFVRYVNANAYDNAIVHFSDSSSILHAGAFTGPDFPADYPASLSDPRPIPAREPIPYEASGPNSRGTIGLSTVSGQPNTGRNQFYFNVSDNPGINSTNGGGTVFGRVLGSGMSVVTAMSVPDSYDASQYYGSTAFSNLPLWNKRANNIVQPNDFVKFTDVSVIPETGLMSFTVTSSNPSKLTASVINGQIRLARIAGETGEVTVSVEVRSALGGSTKSDTFVVDLGSTKPSAPTNVAGVAGNRQVSLTWTAPASTGASAITDYVVEYSSDGGGTWTTFNDGTSAKRSATVTGLTNGVSYVFRVSAVNEAGVGPASPSSAAVIRRTVAGAPTAVTATPGNARVSLTWTAPASTGGSAITDYVVQYSSDGGRTWTTFDDGTSANGSATVTGLTNGRNYVFRVSAVNAVGTGPASARTGIVVPRTVAGAPTAVTATPGNARVSLTWTAPASTGGSAITDYVVQYSSDGGRTWTTFNDGTRARRSATVTGLTNGRNYVFRVSAVNAVGTGPASARTGIVVPRTVAGAPTAVTATPGNARVSLTWGAPASTGGSAITDYVVQYSSDGGSTWTTFADRTSARRSATVTGLTNGGNYVFRVSAVNAVGTGPASARTGTVTPRTVANAATAVTATPGNAQVSLTWTAPASTGGSAITDYVVQYGSDGRTWTTFDDGTSADGSATVTGLTNGKKYVFRVFAVNAVGTGPASARSGTVTPRTAALS